MLGGSLFTVVFRPLSHRISDGHRICLPRIECKFSRVTHFPLAYCSPWTTYANLFTQQTKTAKSEKSCHDSNSLPCHCIKATQKRTSRNQPAKQPASHSSYGWHHHLVVPFRHLVPMALPVESFHAFIYLLMCECVPVRLHVVSFFFSVSAHSRLRRSSKQKFWNLKEGSKEGSTQIHC